VSHANTIETRLCNHFVTKGLTLSVAESCSGGLIAHRLTNVPGCSAYFLGGVVSYSNAAKSGLLGVSEAELAAHGAVSEPMARQMAEGARQRFGADWAVGVTGIAGPSGGTPNKPVGLVYVGIAGPVGTDVVRLDLRGNRLEIKEQTAESALHLLWERLQ